MPALTPEQRRKQIEMQRQRDAAAKAANKPKPGQKGVQTSGGSKTKGSTIGGAKPVSKPTTKPATKPTTKTKVADYNDAQGNTYDGNTGRLKSKVAAKPAAKPAPKPSSGGRTYASASTPTTTASVTAPKPAGKVPSSGGSYGADGKGLYNAGKKDNPLMKRTFGYQTGDAPDQRKTEGVGPVADGSSYAQSVKNGELGRAQNDAYKAQIKAGPGDTASGSYRNKDTLKAEPAKPNSNRQADVNVKPKTTVDKNYSKQFAKAKNNTSTSFDGRMNLLEELRKRRKG